jgi:RNA recognition motif-containing protein
MAKKLYVGNLSYSVDSSGLQQLFGAHGTVESAEIIAIPADPRASGSCR